MTANHKLPRTNTMSASGNRIQFQPFEADEEEDCWIEISPSSTLLRGQDTSGDEKFYATLTSAAEEENVDKSFGMFCEDACDSDDSVPSTPRMHWHIASATDDDIDEDTSRPGGEKSVGEEKKTGSKLDEENTDSPPVRADPAPPAPSAQAWQEELKFAVSKLKHEAATLIELPRTQGELVCSVGGQEGTDDEAAEHTVDDIKAELDTAKLQRELFMELKHELTKRELQRMQDKFAGAHREHEQATDKIKAELDTTKEVTKGLLEVLELEHEDNLVELDTVRLQRELIMELKHELTKRELRRMHAELAGAHQEHEHATDKIKAELDITKELLDVLELEHEDTLEELLGKQEDLACFWKEHEHVVTEIKTELDAVKMQRDDLEKKLGKKEEALARAQKEVETLKKVINLSTSMVTMQRDHAVTAVAEKDMLLQNYKEKIERLKAELLQSQQREQKAEKASEKDIKTLKDRLASVEKPTEELEDTRAGSPVKETVEVGAVPFTAVPLDVTKALAPIRSPFTVMPIDLPNGPRTPISPSYSKGMKTPTTTGTPLAPDKENEGKPMVVPSSLDGKKKEKVAPTPRVAFSLVDALINSNLTSLKPNKE